MYLACGETIAPPTQFASSGTVTNSPTPSPSDSEISHNQNLNQEPVAQTTATVDVTRAPVLNDITTLFRDLQVGSQLTCPKQESYWNSREASPSPRLLATRSTAWSDSDSEQDAAAHRKHLSHPVNRSGSFKPFQSGVGGLTSKEKRTRSVYTSVETIPGVKSATSSRHKRVSISSRASFRDTHLNQSLSLSFQPNCVNDRTRCTRRPHESSRRASTQSGAMWSSLYGTSDTLNSTLWPAQQFPAGLQAGPLQHVPSHIIWGVMPVYPTQKPQGTGTPSEPARSPQLVPFQLFVSPISIAGTGGAGAIYSNSTSLSNTSRDSDRKTQQKAGKLKNPSRHNAETSCPPQNQTTHPTTFKKRPDSRPQQPLESPLSAHPPTSRYFPGQDSHIVNSLQHILNSRPVPSACVSVPTSTQSLPFSCAPLFVTIAGQIAPSECTGSVARSRCSSYTKP